MEFATPPDTQAGSCSEAPPIGTTIGAKAGLAQIEVGATAAARPVPSLALPLAGRYREAPACYPFDRPRARSLSCPAS